MVEQRLPPVEIVIPDDESPAEPADGTIARLRRRQRLLGALVVVAAAGGAVAGAAVERAGGDDAAGLRAASESDDVPPSADATDIDDGAGTVESSETLYEGESRDAVAASGMGGGAYGPTMTWLGSGASGDMDVRLLFIDYGPQNIGNPLWEPPPGCFSTGSWSIQVSTARFAAVLPAERLDMPDRPDGTVHLVGVPEGDPRWVAMATVDPAAAAFTMPDGQVVPATDVGGVAFAAAPAPGWADVPQHPTGHEATVDVGGRTFPVSTWWSPDERFYTEQCQPPPPELPAPGEQPPDPAAAEESVRAALDTMFGNPDDEAKAAAVEHPDVVLPASEQVAANYPDISAEAEIVELVFTSPDTAFYRFHLDADIASFPDQIGEARLVDGRWLITAETVCAQLGRGGGQCDLPS